MRGGRRLPTPYRSAYSRYDRPREARTRLHSRPRRHRSARPLAIAKRTTSAHATRREATSMRQPERTIRPRKLRRKLASARQRAEHRGRGRARSPGGDARGASRPGAREGPRGDRRDGRRRSARVSATEQTAQAAREPDGELTSVGASTCPIGSRLFRPMSAGSADRALPSAEPGWDDEERAGEPHAPSYAWVELDRCPRFGGAVRAATPARGAVPGRRRSSGGGRRARRAGDRRRHGRLVGARGADRVGLHHVPTSRARTTPPLRAGLRRPSRCLPIRPGSCRLSSTRCSSPQPAVDRLTRIQNEKQTAKSILIKTIHWRFAEVN